MWKGQKINQKKLPIAKLSNYFDYFDIDLKINRFSSFPFSV